MVLIKVRAIIWTAVPVSRIVERAGEIGRTITEATRERSHKSWHAEEEEEETEEETEAEDESVRGRAPAGAAAAVVATVTAGILEDVMANEIVAMTAVGVVTDALVHAHVEGTTAVVAAEPKSLQKMKAEDSAEKVGMTQKKKSLQSQISEFNQVVQSGLRKWPSAWLTQSKLVAFLRHHQLALGSTRRRQTPRWLPRWLLLHARTTLRLQPPWRLPQARIRQRSWTEVLSRLLRFPKRSILSSAPLRKRPMLRLPLLSRRPLARALPLRLLRALAQLRGAAPEWLRGADLVAL